MNKVQLKFNTQANGTFDNTFSVMKEYQEAGLANKESTVIFNGVEVPAGYYETWQESFKMYSSLVNGNLDALKDSIPTGLSEAEVFSMTAVISKTYKDVHGQALSEKYLDSLLEKANKPKTM